jgi:hypothetical protein
MLLKRGFTNLRFSRAVVTDSLFQTVVMAQTKYSTVGENPYDHAERDKLHWLPLPTLSLKKIIIIIVTVYVDTSGYFHTSTITYI